ncbi:MAG: VirB4 family type IV secretion system protein [Thermoplasmata archaeon]
MTDRPEEIEAATWLRLGRCYRAPLLVRQFPSEVPFGFLGRVLPTTEPVELSLELYRIPPPRALEILHGARAVAEAELASGDPGARTPELEAERETAESVGRAVARRTQELWKVGLRFVAAGPSRPRCEAVRARLGERLAALGFRTRVPRYEVRSALGPPALAGTEPRPGGYWHTLPTDGVAALFPFADESVVEPGGILVGLALSDASPVFLNRWEHASHSWGLFGTTGSGKSFAAALLALRSRWMRPDVEVTILDPLGEFGSFVRALGGSVIGVARGEGGRLNPLDPVTTGGDRREKAARVGTMLRALFPSLDDVEAATLDTAVSGLYASGPGTPTWDDLLAELEHDGTPVGRLGSLLDIFRSGSLRSVNGPTTVPDGPGPTAVDFRGVTDDRLPFHLSYVLDWAYGRLRDRPGPKLLIVDEAHLLLRHSATAEFLDRVVRHVRHFDGGILLVSQSPDDFLGRPEGRAVLRNLYATGFLRLPEVSAEARAFFGLTPAESEWLPKARLPREAGYSESLWRIGAFHLPLALIASTPEYDFLTGTLGRPDRGSGDAPRAGVL